MSLFDFRGRHSRSEESTEEAPEQIEGVADAQVIDADEDADEDTDEDAAGDVSGGVAEGTIEESKSDEITSQSEEAEDAEDAEEATDAEEAEEAEEDAEEPATEAEAESDEVEVEESESNSESESESKNEEDADKGENADVGADANDEDDDANDDDANDEDDVEDDDPIKHAKHAAPAYALPTEDDAVPKKKSRVGKGVAIALCIVLALVGIAYGAGTFVFMNRLLPNTTIGDYDISLNTDEEAVQLIQSIANNYTIEVKNGAFSYKTNKSELGLTIDAQEAIDAIHERYSAFLWPYYILQPQHDVSDLLNVEFNRESYKEGFAKAIEDYNKEATPPTNAQIYYDETAKKFLVKDEIIGTQIDTELAFAAFENSVEELKPVMRITEAELVQPKFRSSDERAIESARLATDLISARISLAAGDKVLRELHGQEMVRTISIDENLEVGFNEDELYSFCAEVANSFNTVGTERTYTRPDGKVISVSGGVYGWRVDLDTFKNLLVDAVHRGEAATIEVPFIESAAVYVEPGQRDWGNRYIDVDLSEQYVRYYDEDNNIIWETPCISGAPDGYHNTPTGVYVVNLKKSPCTLVGYEGNKKIYESQVTYWMPFIDNSIGFHDATWQPSFGGSMYANGYGSHGCVNLSYYAAQELYGIVPVGEVVVVHW